MKIKTFIFKKVNLLGAFLRRMCKKDFLKAHTRYVGVLVVFALALFYNISIVPHDSQDKSSDDEKEETKEDQTIARPSYDLDADTTEKTYGGKCALAVPGGFYRMTFVIDSNKEESVNVFVRSKSGETQDIGDIALSGVSDNFVSFVFRSEYFCSDVVVKRADVSNENSWDDTRIHITQLSLSPVLVASEGQAASLEPSLLSVLRQEDVPVPSMIGGGSAAKQLSLKGGQIGNDVRQMGSL